MSRLRRPPDVYILRQMDKNGTEAKPRVHIEVTSKGELTYGVAVSAANLARARKIAEREFARLRAFAKKEGA